MYLHALPTSKKCVPELITDPIALIRDVRTVVEKHRYDKAELAVTSKPVLEWWSRVSVCSVSVERVVIIGFTDSHIFISRLGLFVV